MKRFPEDVLEFLNQPQQLAIFSTIDGQGFPHVTPMWYAYEDNLFWMWTRKDRAKYGYTRQHRQVGFYIQAVDDVHKGLTLQGTVEHRGKVPVPYAEKIASRYVSEEEVAIWVDHILYGQSVLLEVRPAWWARNGSSWNV
jgi:hypothetical protein